MLQMSVTFEFVYDTAYQLKQFARACNVLAEINSYFDFYINIYVLF